jgi:hypothetical protein
MIIDSFRDRGGENRPYRDTSNGRRFPQRYSLSDRRTAVSIRSLTSTIDDPRKREIAAAQRHVTVMTRATAPNGHAQQAAPAQDPILAKLDACRAQREAQLALEGRVGAIQRKVSDLVALRTAALRVLTDTPRAEEPAAPLTARARVNMLVRT